MIVGGVGDQKKECMMVITSRSFRSVIAQYQDFCDREAQKGRQDYERFISLEQFLTGGKAPAEGSSEKGAPVEATSGSITKRIESKEAGRAPTKEEKKLEEHKQQRLTGRRGLQKAFSRQFKDLLYDYMPGGYFTYNDYAKKAADDFYRRAYAGFKDLLPRLVVEKMREADVDVVDTGSIKVDPETVNEVITDAVLWLEENPDQLKKGLINAFSKSAREQDRGVGLGEAFFSPRVDDKTFARMKEEAAEEGESLGKKPVDERVLDQLEEGKEIKWKWEGIDENRRLEFSLPDLSGSRTFTIQIPENIKAKSLRPGEYTFKVKSKKKNGVVLEFAEHKEDIEKKDILEEIETDGLGPDQLVNFIYNGVVSAYKNFLRSQSTEKLLEDYLGHIKIKGTEVEDISDLKKLQEEGPKARGEEIKKERAKAQEREREKIDRIIDAWTPVLAKYFLSLGEDGAEKIADAVSRKFPDVPQGAVTFQAILGTRPMVKEILETIMDPTTPMGIGGKAEPWKILSKDKIIDLVDTDPDFKRVAAMYVMKKEPGKYEFANEVPDEDIKAHLGSMTQADWASAIQKFVPKIREMILSMKGHPALQRFFERRRTFRGYIEDRLSEHVETIIEEQDLDLTSKKDLKKIDDEIRKMVNKTVKLMQKSADDKLLRDVVQLMMKKGVNLS